MNEWVFCFLRYSGALGGVGCWWNEMAGWKDSLALLIRGKEKYKDFYFIN